MADSIKRQITIELQLEGSKAAKAAAESQVNLVRSAVDEMQTAYNGAFSAVDAAAKKAFERVSETASKAAYEVERSFASIGKDSGAEQFANSWKLAITSVRDQMQALNGGTPVSPAAPSAPSETTKPVPRKGKAGGIAGDTAAAKAHFESLEKYAAKAAASVQASFDKVSKNSGADRFATSWKSSIEAVNAQLRTIGNVQIPAPAVTQAPSGPQPAPVPATSNAPSTPQKRQPEPQFQVMAEAASAASASMRDAFKSVADSVKNVGSEAKVAAARFGELEKAAAAAAKATGKVKAPKVPAQPTMVAPAPTTTAISSSLPSQQVPPSQQSLPPQKSSSATPSSQPQQPRQTGYMWQNSKWTEADISKVEKAEQKAIEQLDKQRGRAVAQQLKDQEKLENQRKADVAKALKDQERRQRENDKAAEKALKDQERIRKAEAVAAGKRDAEVARWQAVHEAANRKVLDSSKALLEGTMQVAKGLAYVGLVAEEDMAKVAKTMVGIEAGVNIIKGSVTAWTAVVDILKAAKAATLAQAAANEVLAASQASVAAAAAAGNAAGLAGNIGASAAAGAAGRAAGGAAAGAAGSAVGGAAAGAAAGAAGAGAVGGGVGGASAALWGLAAPVVKIAAVSLVAAESLQAVRRAMGDTSASSESFIGALFSWRKASADAAKSAEKLAKAEEAQQRRREQTQKRETQIAARSAAQFAFEDRQESDRKMFSQLDPDPNMTDLKRGLQSRAAAASATERAEADHEAYDTRVNDRKNRGEAFSFADQTQQYEKESRAAEMRKAAELEIYQALQQQLDMRKQLLEQSRAAAEQAKSALEQEQERTKDKVAQFGRLSKGEQERIGEIAKRHSSGEQLSRADIDSLERAGVGGNIVRDYYAKKGEEAGALGILGQTGDRDAEDDAHFNSVQANGELEKARMMQEQAAQELSDQFKKLKEAAESATEAFKALQRAQAAQNGTGADQSGPAPSGNGSDVAGVGLGMSNGVDAMGRQFNRTVDQVIENARRQQANIAASQIV